MPSRPAIDTILLQLRLRVSTFFKQRKGEISSRQLDERLRSVRF